MLPQVAKLKGMALDFLFPQWCIGCGKEGSFLCRRCRLSLPRIMPPLCPRCGRPQSSGILCPGCVGWQAEIDGIRSPFRFEGVIRQVVYQLKYRNLRALAPSLAGMMSDYFASNPVPAEVLVPIPLHRKRLRERGYNQSSLLAEELGKLTGLPVVENCLVRSRHASPQVRAPTLAERRANVAGAFTCLSPSLSNKQVLLVDDVSTSGATLDACARALKEAGAASVWGLVFAMEM